MTRLLLLALSACTPPPGDCLLVNHVVYSCEEVKNADQRF